LQKQTEDKRVAETLTKAILQLRKVSLPYNRLALSNPKEGLLQAHKFSSLDIYEVIERVLEHLTETDRNEVRVKHSLSPFIRIQADMFQLTFCFESILSYLLRFVQILA
jgi:hypothetical protein